MLKDKITSLIKVDIRKINNLFLNRTQIIQEWGEIKLIQEWVEVNNILAWEVVILNKIWVSKTNLIRNY
jgi:hypothetical protein